MDICVLRYMDKLRFESAPIYIAKSAHNFSGFIREWTTRNSQSLELLFACGCGRSPCVLPTDYHRHDDCACICLESLSEP